MHFLTTHACTDNCTDRYPLTPPILSLLPNRSRCPQAEAALCCIQASYLKLCHLACRLQSDTTEAQKHVEDLEKRLQAARQRAQDTEDAYNIAQQEWYAASNKLKVGAG